MRHIDYGLCMLKKEALERVPPDQPYDLALLYEGLVKEGQLAGFEVFKRFYEIGTIEGLTETRELLSQQLKGGNMEDYTTTHLKEASRIIPLIDTAKIETIVRLIAELRSRGGRLFFLGVGGSAANASHAVNDFRKLAGIESYSPTDNVSVAEDQMRSAHAACNINRWDPAAWAERRLKVPAGCRGKWKANPIIASKPAGTINCLSSQRISTKLSLLPAERF
jgi:hypothetical protein